MDDKLKEFAQLSAALCACLSWEAIVSGSAASRAWASAAALGSGTCQRLKALKGNITYQSPSTLPKMFFHPGHSPLCPFAAIEGTPWPGHPSLSDNGFL